MNLFLVLIDLSYDIQKILNTNAILLNRFRRLVPHPLSFKCNSSRLTHQVLRRKSRDHTKRNFRTTCLSCCVEGCMQCNVHFQCLMTLVRVTHQLRYIILYSRPNFLSQFKIAIFKSRKALFMRRICSHLLSWCLMTGSDIIPFVFLKFSFFVFAFASWFHQ